MRTVQCIEIIGLANGSEVRDRINQYQHEL